MVNRISRYDVPSGFELLPERPAKSGRLAVLHLHGSDEATGMTKLMVIVPLPGGNRLHIGTVCCDDCKNDLIEGDADGTLCDRLLAHLLAGLQAVVKLRTPEGIVLDERLVNY